MSEWWDGIKADFVLNFIKEDRWMLLATGLGNTLKITFVALIIGILLGSIVATVRSTYDKNGADMSKRNKGGYVVLSIFNIICKLYLTVIRGTPMVVQLLIMYFIIFASSKNGLMVAMIAFGINSGAYVAEIIRGGLKDPRISPWTSVVAVEVALDLKSCKAWISVLGDEEVRKSTLQGLKSAEGFIRRELARTINLRNTPEIRFILDQSIEYGVNMSHKIDEVIAADEQAQKPENEVVEDTEETEEGDE